jgi:hypothetical protein
MFGADRPPPGWDIRSGYLSEMPTVAGYAQRHCAVRGHCQTRECRRTIRFDWEDLISHGQATLQVQFVQDAYRCNKIGRCSIQWFEEPSRRVTLGDLVGREHIAVQVRCTGNCRSIHVMTVGAMIVRLQTAKTGGHETDVKKLTEAIPGPCTKCEQRLWRTEILWFDPSAAHPPQWRKDLTQRLDEARFRKASEPMAPGPPPAQGAGRMPRSARG